MDEVDISDGSDDERFKRGCGKALDDACSEKILVADLGLTDSCADDIEQCRDQEDGSFAIFAPKGGDQGANAACGEEIVAGGQHDGVDGLVDCQRDFEVRGVQERSVSSGVQHSTKGKNSDDDFFLQ